MFNLFSSFSSRYADRCRKYLENAQTAALEHQIAAEHHAALAEMYQVRVQRLQAELARHDGQSGSPIDISAESRQAPASLSVASQPRLKPAF